jgi:hypothetical protein
MRLLPCCLALLFFACSGGDSSSPDSHVGDGRPADLAEVVTDILDTSVDVRAVAADGAAEAVEEIEELAADLPEAADLTDAGDVASLVWPEPVALQVVDGLPLVPGAYDDSETWPFVLDTLSQICFVDNDLVGDFLYHEVDATIGADTLIDLLVKGREMAPDEMYLGVDIGGLVGQSFFQQRFVVMDYPGSQLYTFATSVDLAQHLPPGYDGEPVVKIDVAQQNAFPVVSVTIGGAAEVPLLADTSSRISVITQSIFDQVDDGSLPQVGGYRFASKYGEDAAFLTRLPSLAVGDLTVTGIEAVVIPDDHHLVAVLEPNGVFVEGYLGAQFWNRFVLAIDAFGGDEFTAQVFSLVGNGKEPVAWEARWHKVGIELAWLDGFVLVDMVYEGSDAENLGLEVGDMVLMIDGIDVDEVSLEEARAMLRGIPGDTIEVIVSKPLSDEPWAEAVAVEEILP